MIRSRRFVLPTTTTTSVSTRIAASSLFSSSSRQISSSLLLQNNNNNHNNINTSINNNINNNCYQQSINNIPQLQSSQRFQVSAASVGMGKHMEEDDDANVEGLETLAAGMYSPDSFLLVTIGWQPQGVGEQWNNVSSIPNHIVFMTSNKKVVEEEVEENNNNANEKEEENNQFVLDISSLKKQSTSQDVIQNLRSKLLSFLIENASKKSSENCNSIVILPFQRDATFDLLSKTILSGLVREEGKNFYAPSSSSNNNNSSTNSFDAWSQVYLMNSEHRRKSSSDVKRSIPLSLEASYKYLLGHQFRPEGKLSLGSASTSKNKKDNNSNNREIAAAAFAAELALETMIATVSAFQPPLRKQSLTQGFTTRDVSILRACARIVPPVNYFVLRVDKSVAKSIRDPVSIRIEIYNPQRKHSSKFELKSANVSDPVSRNELDRFEKEVASDFSSISCLLLTPDTKDDDAQSILRSIFVKNPTYMIRPHILARYIDGDAVTVPERFAENFEFNTVPKLLWENLRTAVNNESALVSAIVAAVYRRRQVAKSFAFQGSVPRQMNMNFGGVSSSSAAIVDRPEEIAEEVIRQATAAAGSIPRAHTYSAFASSRGGQQEQDSSSSFQRKKRGGGNVDLHSPGEVRTALQAWTDTIYQNPERNRREEVAAKKLERYFIFDIETTTASKYRRLANPFTGDNHIVLPGGLDHNGRMWMPKRYLEKSSPLKLPDLSQYDVLVGHNVKFDLLYVWHHPEVQKFLARGGLIWDTMYAEYLLTGHEVSLRSTGAGLDAVAASYGGTIRKLDEVKQAFKNGVPTYEIPYKTLAEYLRGDLKNTEFIFKKQRRRALAQKQMIVAQHRMDGLLCTTEMEFNGLFMNTPLAKIHSAKLIAESSRLKKELENFVPSEIPHIRRNEFNWFSTKQLATVLFGGEYKFENESVKKNSWRNDRVNLFSGAGESLEPGAHLAFISNNLQGKALKTFVHPFLRSAGLRTSGSLAENFSDEESERRFETFFYGVDLFESSSSSSMKNSSLLLEEYLPEHDWVKRLKNEESKIAAAELAGDVKNRKVKNISVANLFHGVAFEGSVVENNNSSSSLKTTTKEEVVKNLNGTQYPLKVTRVSGTSFEKVKSALNSWINDILISTSPESEQIISSYEKSQSHGSNNKEDVVNPFSHDQSKSRVALLFGRRNCEFFEPILRENGFSPETFTSDNRIPTRMFLGEDDSLEMNVVTHFPKLAKKIMYENNNINDIAATIEEETVSKSKKKKSSSAKKKSKKKEVLAEEEQEEGNDSTTTFNIVFDNSMANFFEREQKEGGFSSSVVGTKQESQKKNNHNGVVSPLQRAIHFGDRAIRLAKFLTNEYHRRKELFLQGDYDAAGCPEKGSKMAVLAKHIPDLTTEAKGFQMKAIPRTCFLDVKFATVDESPAGTSSSSSATKTKRSISPEGKGGKKSSSNKNISSSSSSSSSAWNRRDQLVLLRSLGSQLRDQDPFAIRLETEPPRQVKLKGVLAECEPNENQHDEIEEKFKSKKTKQLQVGEEVLEYFAKKYDSQLCKTLLDTRNIEKQLSTYYEDKRSGMMALVHSNDSCIHHELIHNVTITGRLSSANPNCQNIPKEGKSGIRELFVSRFGENEGVCIEADYSQLEVVVLCCLSKDKQMTHDLTNKVDFHCKRVAMMRPDLSYEEVLQRAKIDKEPEFVELRSKAKIFSFQRQYGAGVKMLSASTGLSEETIKQIMQKESETYRDIELYYNMVKRSCNTFDPALQTGAKNKHGDSILKGMFPVLTGSRYVFTQTDVPFDVLPGEPTTNFSPTFLKNYPVQGFAGEIVQIMLGQLFRHFVQNNNYDGKAFLTNTVHDCVWIDARREVAKQVCDDVAKSMSSARQVLNEYWPEIDCEVEFPVDVVIGPNMGHMEGVGKFFAAPPSSS